MNDLTKIILIIPFLLLIVEEAIFFLPRGLYFFLFVINFLIIFSIYKIAKNNLSSDWRNFIVFPFIFFNSLILYCLTIPSKYFLQALFIFSVLYLRYYLNSIYYFLHKPALYRSFSIENISSYGNFIAVYFTSSALFGIQSFLNWPTWLIILIFIVFFTIVIYQVLWANKIPPARGFAHIFIAGLLLTPHDGCLPYP